MIQTASRTADVDLACDETTVFVNRCCQPHVRMASLVAEVHMQLHAPEEREPALSDHHDPEPGDGWLEQTGRWSGEHEPPAIRSHRRAKPGIRRPVAGQLVAIALVSATALALLA